MSLANYYRRCALPKGRKQSTIRRGKKETRGQVIRATRVKVWRRSAGRCEFCGDSERQTLQKYPGIPARHQMDEVFLSRAQGRGQPPEFIFNEWNCARACPVCHEQKTLNLIDIIAKNPAQGCAGGLFVRPHQEKPSARRES